MDILSGTLTFISEHANDDVRRLALTAKRDDSVDLPFALDQIAGRQKARTKLPSWFACEGLIYPPHISMEQCSSETTSLYKRNVADRILSLAIPNEKMRHDATLIDCTGGFGVDFSFLARAFAHSLYIERQQHLCDIASHNLPLLGLTEAQVLCRDAEEVMHDVSSVAGDNPVVVFIDPARRDINGRRTYAIADCTPDILRFIDTLSKDCEAIIIKLSPMLDWHATVSDICKACGDDVVREVHIVSTGNECKELLIVVSRRYSEPLRIFCVNDESIYSFDAGNERGKEMNEAPGTPLPYPIGSEEDGKRYLLVPNASVMKAGCFDILSSTFRIQQISDNSHLFISKETTNDFPGKVFDIKAVSTMNKKELRKNLSGITQANISTRNFPLSPDQLRKRLKMKDGGSTFIFATTSQKGDHLLYITQPID